MATRTPSAARLIRMVTARKKPSKAAHARAMAEIGARCREELALERANAIEQTIAAGLDLDAQEQWPEQPRRRRKPLPRDLTPARMKLRAKEEDRRNHVLRDLLKGLGQKQRRIAADARALRQNLQYSVGNPRTLVCLNQATVVDSVVVDRLANTPASSVSFGRQITREPLRNRVAFFAAVLSEHAGGARARLAFATTHEWIFFVNAAGRALVAPSFFLSAVGTYRLTAPTAFPGAGEIPLVSASLTATVEARIHKNMGDGRTREIPLPGKRTVTFLNQRNTRQAAHRGPNIPTLLTFPLVSVGTLGEAFPDATTIVDYPAFMADPSELVLFRVTYSLVASCQQGASAVFNAISASEAGLNVPAVWLLVDH